MMKGLKILLPQDINDEGIMSYRFVPFNYKYSWEKFIHTRCLFAINHQYYYYYDGNVYRIKKSIVNQLNQGV